MTYTTIETLLSGLMVLTVADILGTVVYTMLSSDIKNLKGLIFLVLSIPAMIALNHMWSKPDIQYEKCVTEYKEAERNLQNFLDYYPEYKGENDE